MLATLNLQLLPAELPDETLQASALLVPEGGSEAPAGFADLLRLRVDDTVTLPATAGELLPQGGSELPLEPIAVAAELPAELPLAPGIAAPELAGQTTPVVEPQTLPDVPVTDTDISLEAVVLYPAKVPAEALTTAAEAMQAAPSVSTTVAPASSVSVNPLPGSNDSRLAPAPEARPLPLTERPLAPRPLNVMAETVAGREQMPSNAERLPPAFANNSPAERPVVTTAQLPAAATVEKSAPPPELPLRPTVAAGAERSDAIARELAPLLRARPIVAQPSQTLQAQLNLQPPPNLPAITAPAPSLVSTDLSYAAAAQQATDLISTSVRDLAWGERVGERVIMMAGNQLKSAEIRLTPAEMGPLRVQVAIDDGATNVTFHAQHAVTRDALEQALPRLREMLAENGLTLGDAQVGDDGVKQGSRDAEHEATASIASAGDSADSAADQTSVADRPATLSRGLLDTFA